MKKNTYRPKNLALTVGTLLLAALCILPQATSAAWQARVATPTANKAGTAAYFTCLGATGADSGSAVFVYRLSEASNTVAVADSSGRNSNGTYRGTMTSDATTPACPRDPTARSYVLNGTNAYITNSTTRTPVNTFTLEIWFKTTVGGGKLIGWGNSDIGLASTYDRHLYLTNAGVLMFGVYPDAVKTISSSTRLNDGVWHHAVATLSTGGMKLYVDGNLVAADAAVTTAQGGNGFWRIGYDNLDGWTNAPTNRYFTGNMRFAAVYTTALTDAQVRTHYNAGL